MMINSQHPFSCEFCRMAWGKASM